MKKLISIISLLLITTLLISSCGCNKENTESLNTAVTFGENVVALVGENEITLDDINVYIASYIPYIQQQTGADEGWESVLLDDKTARDTLIEYAIEEARYQSAFLTAVRNLGGYSLEDEEAYYKEYVEANGGEEEYQKFLSESGITDAAFKKYLASVGAYYSVCSEEEAAEVYKNDFIRAKHILIKFDTRASEEAAYDEALDAYNRAVKGEKFEKLIDELNEDPGENSEMGYTFGEGEMVQEFYEGALNLEINGISKPVKTSYGYHVIKRYPLYEEGTEVYNNYIYNIINNKIYEFVNGKEMTKVLDENALHINESILSQIDLSRYTLSSTEVSE